MEHKTAYTIKFNSGLFWELCKEYGVPLSKNDECLMLVPKYTTGEWKEDNGLLMLLTALFFSQTERRECHNDFSEGSTEKR